MLGCLKDGSHNPFRGSAVPKTGASPEVKHKNCSKVGGKNEIWRKDALINGEVKLIRSHAKIDVEIHFRGTSVFTLDICL